MPNSGWWLVLLAWLAGCAGAAAAAPPAHLTQAALHQERAGAGWEPPRTLPPEVVDAAAAWADVPLPHARSRSIATPGGAHRDAPEVAWYRLAVPPPGAAGAELFLYLPRWQTIGTVAVYADGRLAWRSRGSRVWNGFNRPLWVGLADPATGRPPHTVLLRMASQPGVGGAISTAWIGTEAQLQWRWQVRSFMQNGLVSYTGAAFLVVGLFSLAVWCVRRHEPMYGLFFAATLTHLLGWAHFVVGGEPLPLPDGWFGWLTVNALGWTTVCIFLFALRVHRQPMPRLALGVSVLVALCSLLTLPVPLVLPHLDAILPLVYGVFTLLMAVIAVSGLRASYRARSREGLVLFGWFSLAVPVGVHDLLLQSYRIDMEHIYLAPYTAMGLYAIFMAIAWRRYVGAIRAVEQVNAGLEERLAAREQALTASHEQLRRLEREQALAAERRRMMQDMHDGIGSSLMSALRMVERGQARPADTAQVLKDCIDDLKLAIDSLDPADADLLGLLAAVRFRLAPRLKAAGIALAWSVQDLPPLPWLDPQSALHVLRIVQEVLANILKHSGATAIDVATGQGAGPGGAEVLVRIRDDGRAFEPGAAPPHGAKGLANVRHRVQALGGRCRWAAWAGGGEFSLWLPLAR